jgi:hypothetical protein
MAELSDSDQRRQPADGQWRLALFLVGFSIWRLADADYWGAVFGLVVAFCVCVRPTSSASARWRKRAFLVGVITFFAVAALAFWKTLRH